ncbi:transposase [Sabulicella rubraurantiaca]|uniref:transposase n=1 Tax=Sabulicella rubraurantiaca TaxID=2811429 RepID=UPI001A96CB24|nr:transposase [Sabulicella rubraurantiaca]
MASGTGLDAPYLTLLAKDAMPREHPLREVFNGLRYVVRHGLAWRTMIQAG